jgi:hypothetical protein
MCCAELHACARHITCISARMHAHMRAVGVLTSARTFAPMRKRIMSMHRWTDGRTVNNTHKPTNRQTNRQAEPHSERHAHIHCTLTHTHSTCLHLRVCGRPCPCRHARMHAVMHARIHACVVLHTNADTRMFCLPSTPIPSQELTPNRVRIFNQCLQYGEQRNDNTAAVR